MTGSNYEGFLKSGIIEDEIMNREWSLTDILDMDKTVTDIVQDLILDINVETKYYIVEQYQMYEYPIHNFEGSLGELITDICRKLLTEMVQTILTEYLKTAKVEFNDNINYTNKEIEAVENLVEEEDEKLLEEHSQDEKIITLKERIRKDTKQLNNKDKKELGMI
jgi:hypothetical protein